MSIETKDFWTMVALEVVGHITIEVKADDPKDGKSCVVTYCFPDDAAENLDRWMRGEIGPVPKDGEPQTNEFEIIRKVQQSQTRFKNNLHRFNAR